MYATCEGSWFKYTCVTLDLTNVVSWSTVTNQEPVALDMPQWQTGGEVSNIKQGKPIRITGNKKEHMKYGVRTK